MAKTVGVAIYELSGTVLKGSNALASSKTPKCLEANRRQLKWKIAQFFLGLAKPFTISSQVKRTLEEVGYHCKSLQSRDAFMNINIGGLQQGANYWLHSR